MIPYTSLVIQSIENRNTFMASTQIDSVPQEISVSHNVGRWEVPCP